MHSTPVDLAKTLMIVARFVEMNSVSRRQRILKQKKSHKFMNLQN